MPFSYASHMQMTHGKLMRYCVSTLDGHIAAHSLTNIFYILFEDALQFECADEVTVDYIITRNKQDFVETKIPLVTPQELLALLSKNKA